MKQIFLTIAVLLTFTVAVLGQESPEVNSRAPKLNIKEWLDKKPRQRPRTKYTMIEFVHSTNKVSVKRLGLLNELTEASHGKLSVIVLTKEHSDEAKEILTNGTPLYYPAFDDEGKTFEAFGVKYIPYAVIYNRRGKIKWIGGSTTLTNEEVIEIIK